MVSLLVMILGGGEIPVLSADGEDVVRVEGTISKVCQLIGDFDRERNRSTVTLSYTKYGVAGTDLGVSFDHGQKLIFLFGDTVGKNSMSSSGKDDSWAYTTDFEPDDGLELVFYTGSPGNFLPPKVPGVSQGPFEVPMEGVDINGNAYVFFTTNHTEERTMGRSVLTRLDNARSSFKYLYSFSVDKFVNVHVAVIDNSQIEGLPENSGQGLLIWGSGEYRRSDPYLAWMPYGAIETKSELRYFSGTNEKGSPRWSRDENDAVALFHDPVIGEFSVFWNQYVNRWIMFYSGVSMRSAVLPWGPWSNRQVVFNALTEGYGRFIHRPGKDKLSDPLRESTPGGPYGPYIVDRFTKGSPGRSTVYFTLSTWNPYTTVLMKVDLELVATHGTETTTPASTSRTETTTLALTTRIETTSGPQTTDWADNQAGFQRSSALRLGIITAAGLAVTVVIIVMLRKRRT